MNEADVVFESHHYAKQRQPSETKRASNEFSSALVLVSELLLVGQVSRVEQQRKPKSGLLLNGRGGTFSLSPLLLHKPASSRALSSRKKNDLAAV